MYIPENVFKTFDVRGVYKKELNPLVTEKLADSYIHTFNPKEIVLGYDARLGSKPLADVFKNFLISRGVSVIDIGLSSTPRLYYATSKLIKPFGVMFTASHDVKEKTGLKFTKMGFPPTPEDMIQFKKTALSKEFATKSTTRRGLTRTVDIIKDYIKDILNFHPYSFKDFRLIVDCGNSVNSLVAKNVFTKKLGLTKVSFLFDSIDSSFPGHESNPKLRRNQLPLAKAIKNEKADLGILWDGDADRVYFLDSKGKAISPHFVAGIVSSYLVSKEKFRKTVTADIRAGMVVRDLVQKEGGLVKVIKAWHTEIKYAMQKDKNIIFGSETSGHYVFRDFFKIDDGLLMSLIFLQAVSNKGYSLNSLLSSLRNKYFVPEEINFKHDDQNKVFSMLENSFGSDGEINYLDGLTIESSLWRFNIRPSKTEPVLRLNFSGRNDSKVKDTFKKVLNVIELSGGVRET